MRNSYKEENSLISFEQFELAASEIVFLKKTIAYIQAEITASHQDYNVDKEVEAIYWLQPFIRVIGGQLFDSSSPNVNSDFTEEIDVLVSLNKEIYYIVYLDGTKELILAQGEPTSRPWGFRDFLYILLNIAIKHLEELQNATEFLSGSQKNETLQ